MKILGQKIALHYLSEGLKSKRLSPSLLFTGADGIGKRTVALELAKALLSGKEKLSAGGDEPSDQKVDGGNHPDLLVINKDLQAQLVKGKPEAQRTVRIEAVRHITKFLSFKPMEAPRRVAIVEDAHTMTIEAANALLKVLEEPPQKAQLVLLAVDERNLPSTIRSRCAVLRFQPLPSKDIANWLLKNQEITVEKANELADLAGGSISRAMELAEEEKFEIELNDYSLDEFFDLLSQSSFRTDARKKSEMVLSHLIEEAQGQLEKGDMNQKNRLETLMKAKKQIERYVSPKLVLENLYLTLR